MHKNNVARVYPLPVRKSAAIGSLRSPIFGKGRFVLVKKTAFFVSIIVLAVSVTLNLSMVFGVSVASPKKNYSVVIDAGHGGVDGGTEGVVSNARESDLNLMVAFELKEYMNELFDVVMTRTTREGLYGDYGSGFKRRDMLARRDIIGAANPDMVVSIHMNRFSSSYRRGAQVCYQEGDEDGKNLAICVQKTLNKYINFPQQGKNFEPIAGNYFILKCCEAPGVIVECGFLSNPEDDALLNDGDYRRELAYLIYAALSEYMAVSVGAEY